MKPDKTEVSLEGIELWILGLVNGTDDLQYINTELKKLKPRLEALLDKQREEFVEDLNQLNAKVNKVAKTEHKVTMSLKLFDILLGNIKSKYSKSN